MTREDITFYVTMVGVATAIVALIYQIASYHWPRGANPVSASDQQSKPSNRPIWINTVLVFIILAAVGSDYHDRNAAAARAEMYKILLQWGATTEPKTRAPEFGLVVNTAPLLQYKDDFKLVILVRNAIWADVDAVNDTAIEKSISYTIDGSTFPIVFLAHGHLHYAAQQNNAILFYIVLLPKDVSPDEVTRLADIKHLGGKLIGTAAETIFDGGTREPLAPEPSSPASAPKPQ